MKSRRSRTPFARCYDFYAVIPIRYAISTGISIAPIMLLQPGERGVFVSVQHGGGASKDAGAHGPPYPIIRPSVLVKPTNGPNNSIRP